MMTSFAFILGVVPLVVSEGAGAEMRRALARRLFSGMLGVTLFGIFLTAGVLLRDSVVHRPAGQAGAAGAVQCDRGGRRHQLLPPSMGQGGDVNYAAGCGFPTNPTRQRGSPSLARRVSEGDPRWRVGLVGATLAGASG